MTTEDHDPALDPVDEERVRRLLADAAPGPGSMPEDVAARLDTVIAGLAAERAAAPADPAPDVGPDTGRDDLARRRTRRRWAGALLAAAAVVVAVVAVRPLLSGGPTPSAGSASTAAKAPSGGDLLSGGPGVQGFRHYDLSGPRPRLSSDRLAAGVRRLALSRPALRPGPAPEAGSYPCALPTAGRDADLIAVLLDGRPATLVLAPEAGGTREALVYACGDGTTVLARASVPRG